MLASLLPESVLGGARFSVDAWYSTALDTKECSRGVDDDVVHIFVADVVKPFDTMHKDVWDCVLSRHGLSGLFRHL